jgi:glycogen synthase
MRVLYLTQGFWPYIGGMETIGERLIAGLGRDGFEFAVLTGREDPSLPQQEEHDGVPIHRVDWTQALDVRDAVRLAAVCRQASAIARDWSPDLVHLGFTPAWTALAMGARLPQIAPLVVTFHGWWPQFHLRGPTIIDRVLRAADWVTACSHDALDAARSIYPAIIPRSAAIPNGVDTPGTPVAVPRARPRLLVAAGRLSAEKGFDVLLRAFALVRRRAPDVRLAIAGRGGEEPALVALARGLGIEDAVDFLGWVPRSEVAGLFDRATVVVVPSRQEGFSVTALEAALRARPVVATRVGGTPEVVEDGATGVLVQAEDHGTMATELMALLDDPDRVARMGQAARRRAVAEFSEERHLRAYRDVYLRVTARQDAGRPLQPADMVAR